MSRASEGSSPLVQQMLYQKYSSSQTYFYTNKIHEIIKEKRTSVNIMYEDVEYLLDQEENLKRWYQAREYDLKMTTFKEYYFYHTDCPRVFLKTIEEIYAKWQDRKRDLVYKKLKLIYNESLSNSEDSRQEQGSKDNIALSHFLLEISDYNPYSKKYYLRVEARKEKDRKKAEEQRRQRSRRDIEFLNHELSAMLNDISQLSQISTLQSNTPKRYEKFKKQKYATISIKKSEEKSRNSSTHLSNSNSLIKFNFRKNKDSLEKTTGQEQRKISLRQNSKDKDIPPEAVKMSPKFSSNQVQTQLLKSKSIFSVSSFGILNKQTDLKSLHSKRDPLKINFQSKRLIIEEQQKKYQTQKRKDGSLPKNIIIKTKSTSKLDPRRSVEKIRSKEGSAGKELKNDEFSDKKLAEAHSEFRMRSLKSEFSSNKKSLFHVKPTLQLDKAKRILELKN